MIPTPTTTPRTIKKGPKPTPAVQRALARIEIVDTGYDTPCWLWTGCLSKRGYGKIASRVDGGYVFEGVHRVTWMAAYGPIDEGLHLDHLCAVPRCVNVGHLEPVTPLENNRRQHLRRAGKAIDLPRWD